MTPTPCCEARGSDLPPDPCCDGEAGKTGLQWLWELVAGFQQAAGQDSTQFADAG